MSALDVAIDIVAERTDFYAEAAADLDLVPALTDDAVARIEALAEQRAEEAARAWLATEAFHVGATVKGVFESADVFDHIDDAMTGAHRWASEENCAVEIRQNGQVVHVARPAAGAA